MMLSNHKAHEALESVVLSAFILNFSGYTDIPTYQTLDYKRTMPPVEAHQFVKTALREES